MAPLNNGTVTRISTFQKNFFVETERLQQVAIIQWCDYTSDVPNSKLHPHDQTNFLKPKLETTGH